MYYLLLACVVFVVSLVSGFIYKKKRKYSGSYPFGVMIKFGKKKHLMQIVKNELRFSPSQQYINIEEQQHNHGQGDLLEGKWRIHAEGFKVFHPVTHEFLGKVDRKSELMVSVQDVNDMPVFCLSKFGEEYFEEGNFLVITKNKLDKIKKDFPDATHALIILEPDKFVKSVKKSIGHNIAADEIHYFDYDINDLRMAMFLTTGDENSKISGGFMGTTTYEDRYRHLLCKDKDFAEQNEYRFIILDELISSSKFYKYLFNSKYLIVPISRLERKLKL